MKYGNLNYVTDGTLTASNVTDVKTDILNLKDTNTLLLYRATEDSGPVEISLDIGTTEAVSLVALANLVGIVGNVTITLKLATVSQGSEVVAVSTPVEQTYVSAEFAAVDCDEVVISFATSGGAGQFDLGYMFAGTLSVALDFENILPGIASADPASVARAGNPQTTLTYLVQTADVTLKKRLFSEMRTALVAIYSQGYANPLFWLFDEDCVLTGEVMLAILDSPNVRIDTIYERTGGNLAQATVGLREVF